MNDNTESRVTKPILTLALLLAGGLLVGFSVGRWLAPLAAWIGPVLVMRFARDHKVGRGYLLVLATCMLAVFIGFFSIWMGGLPRPMVPFLNVGIGLLWSLPYLADRLVSPRLRSFSSTFVFTLAVTTLEFAFIHLSPLGTWGAWGFTQYGNVPLMQIASVTGMIGISFLIAWFASVANWAWEHRSGGGGILRGLAIFGAVMAVVALFGFLRLNLAPTSEAEETVRVAGITAMSTSEIYDLRTVNPQSHRDAYFDEILREARAGAKVIVWPELSGFGPASDEASLIARAQEFARQHRIYLAIPLFTCPDELETELVEIVENKLLLIDPAGAIVI